DGHAVLGDAGAAERFLQHHVAPARPEGRLHGTGELRQTRGDLRPRIDVKFHLLGCHVLDSSCQLLVVSCQCERLPAATLATGNSRPATYSITPRMSDSRRMTTFSPSISTSVPEYLPYQTSSPVRTLSSMRRP